MVFFDIYKIEKYMIWLKNTFQIRGNMLKYKRCEIVGYANYFFKLGSLYFKKEDIPFSMGYPLFYVSTTVLITRLLQLVYNVYLLVHTSYYLAARYSLIFSTNGSTSIP